MTAPAARVPDPLPDLRSRAIFGLAWSLVENWGSRGIALATSLILARLLSPEIFGIASAAMLVLALIPLVSELGLADALIQRRGLRDADVTLPFLCAFGMAVLATTAVVWHADPIARWLEIPDHSSFVVALACTVPLTIPLMFQDAMYRRGQHFRLLAVRALVANIVAGAVGIAFALAGYGLWTFVVQAYCGMLLTIAWLAWRPKWSPTAATSPATMLPLLRFGLPTVAQRLVDFFSTRAVDVIVITQIGLAAYGLYALASRLCQTLLQLLQGAFFKVAFTLLSQVSDQRERLVNAYEETVGLAASAISPVFVLLAVLAPEMVAILFDRRWQGVAEIMQPLLLLGAVQAVQYMNGAFLAAAGKPGKSLITGLTRAGVIVAALAIFAGSSAWAVTWVFVLASLSASPLSFAIVTAEIGAPRMRVAAVILGPWAAAALGFALVTALRPIALDAIGGSALRGMVIGAIFLAAYIALLAFLCPSGLRRAVRLGRELATPALRLAPGRAL